MRWRKCFGGIRKGEAWGLRPHSPLIRAQIQKIRRARSCIIEMFYMHEGIGVKKWKVLVLSLKLLCKRIRYSNYFELAKNVASPLFFQCIWIRFLFIKTG